jgi:nucleotide-binding universal stress UspA family protein
MLGWDGSTDADLAVRAVAARSWPESTQLRIVTVLDARLSIQLAVSGMAAGPAQDAIHEEHSEISRRADKVAEELRARGLRVGEPVIRPGYPKSILLEEADKWQAHCIFVGAKGLSRIERVLLGSVSAAVAARAACSVEVVRSRYPA